MVFALGGWLAGLGGALIAPTTTISMGMDAPSAQTNQGLKGGFILVTTLKIALCQMLITADKQANLNQAAEKLQEAAAGGAQLAVLPEMFNCPYDIHCFRNYAEEIPSGETTNHLASLARTHGLFVVGGLIPELAG